MEKEKGTVQRIVNGKILPEPLLDVNVATSQERCMCGVAVSKHISAHIYVFLYYTLHITYKRRLFAAFAARTRGEYDWVNNKIFPNTKIANQESDTYRTAFGDIIEKYEAFDLTVVRPPAFIQATNYSIKEFYEFCKKWFRILPSISEGLYQ